MSKTLVACLTPPGRGAIATVALAGPDAWRIVRDLVTLNGKKLPSTPQSGRIWIGRIGAKNVGHDEVVISAKLTDPPRVELHCHGGTAMVDMLLGLLVSQGAEVRSWQDFEQQTCYDIMIAEAKRLLALALTARTAGILLDQCQGAWVRALEELDAKIAAGPRDQALERIDGILGLAEFGTHLTTPWRVVIAGAPNVGKSSLVNALAGFERSVVSNIPGTTRDVVTTLLSIDGWPVEVSDTAGWRSSSDALEQAGIALADDALRTAEWRLWILDASAAPVVPAQTEPAFQYVINKTDLPATWDLSRFPNALRVSARTGEGLDKLMAAISHGLVPHPPPPGAAVPFCEAAIEELATLGRGIS